MIQNIYIRRDGENLGPFTIEELSSQKIEPGTPVWYDGLGDWTTVKNVPELAGLVKSTPPPFTGTHEEDAQKKSLNNSAPPPYNSVTSDKPADPIAPAIPAASNPSAAKTSNANPNQKFIVIGIVAIVLVAVIVRLVSNNNNGYSSSSMGPTNYDSVRQPGETVRVDSGMSESTGGPYSDAYAPAQTSSGPDEVTLKNMEYRNNWSKYIIASRSDYNYSAAGGISGLSIVVYNTTSYPIDYVAVAVRYITVNGYIHKTETVGFYDIAAGTKQAQIAPNSERGTSVEYEITNIYAKKFRFCFDKNDLEGNGSINDPWKCVN